MKKCIWCNKSEKETSFKTKAHTIPKGLGGITICENVCDSCNFYFGNNQNGSPSIELIIKETFNLSKFCLLNTGSQTINNKNSPHYSSVYFTVDFQKGKIDIKNKYKLRSGFQENICRLIKRGLYKIFLEENERINGDSLNPQYDFIREFARYDLNDFPIYYFERLHPILMSGEGLIKQPHIPFNIITMNYLLRDYGFFEVEFFGHVLSIATYRNWDIAIDKYLSESIKIKSGHFKSYKLIKKWNDIDLSLSLFDVKKR